MEALLYEKLENDEVQCHLCAHRCIIRSGRRGICGVRENRDGRLESLVYGRLIARSVDPIEKKPLFHMMPGSLSYSIATVGCNFRCRFCQNADIAQMPGDQGGKIMGERVEAESVVRDALARRCRSISYTYTEPTVFFEFALDVARLAREKGLKNIFVTNGYMTEDALKMVLPYLDGANVDLKAFDDSFYRKVCGGALEPVLDTLRRMKSGGVLVEVTTLLVPGRNDDPEKLRELADFIAVDLGTDTPWHISRFHPTYRMTDVPPTPVETLRRARDIGLNAGLRYVYPGNVPGEDGESTDCWQCGSRLIHRWGFSIRDNRVRRGRCPDCGAAIDGVELAGD
ncbi:MAG: AmmeMemoRadiSam system radical SAM enzyme [Desulfobacteraceae bacterium]|nr:AmmeMemoRadiSam system radical SAM enzyme [Desulfobacteraceae bacterium]